MNPRRVHELMRQHFPEVDAASRDWVVVADGDGLRRGVLQDLINEYISGADLLVEACRKVGDCLPTSAALDFVAKHAGKGDIRLANRDFTGYVVVLANGVASGWNAH